MVNLVIDIGNSSTKVAVFNNRQLSYLENHHVIDSDLLTGLISHFEIRNSIISSVNGEIGEFEEILRGNTTYNRFSVSDQSIVNVTYQSPQTLGLDRLAAVIGARTCYPGRNCLVIDAGTCITYDAVDAEGTYSGGSISPGLNMRFKAMHSFTGRLPLLSADENFSRMQGSDTATSMISGAQNGIYWEVLGFIQHYSLQYPDLQTILCGGDSKFFDTRLKSSIFAHAFKTEPHLVLIGLNEVIYQHND
jgi:type III pantothenate kinase